jgi:hypothetical protein
MRPTKTQIYQNLPNPKEVKKFNDYIKGLNKVILETPNWMLIKNRFKKKSLVCFLKVDKKYFSDLSDEEIKEMQDILRQYKDCKIYINSISDRSIKDRLHFHIKL